MIPCANGTADERRRPSRCKQSTSFFFFFFFFFYFFILKIWIEKKERWKERKNDCAWLALFSLSPSLAVSHSFVLMEVCTSEMLTKGGTRLVLDYFIFCTQPARHVTWIHPTFLISCHALSRNISPSFSAIWFHVSSFFFPFSLIN